MLQVITLEGQLELQILNALYHDAWFGRDDAAYDAAAGTFTLRLTREAYERRRMKRWILILRHFEIPLVQSTLRFRGVKQASVDLPDVEDVLVTIETRNGGREVVLTGDHGGRIVLSVDSLDVVLQDEHEAPGHTGMWQFF